MRADVLRTYKTLHTWVGIVSGMALFIAFYAGALTIFKEPIANWISPPTLSNHQWLALEETPTLIADTLAAQPSVAKGFLIQLHPEHGAPWQLSWQQRNAAIDGHDSRAVDHFAAYYDADNMVQISQVSPSHMPAFIDTLHRVVGLPFDSDLNRWIMGVIAVMYSLALISGVIILLPTLVKGFFALRVTGKIKRMWLDAHNVVGIISLPFHLVMALTSIVFAYHDQIYQIEAAVIHQSGGGRPAFQATPSANAAVKPELAALLPASFFIDAAKQLSPTFEPTAVQFAQLDSAQANVRVWGKDATGFARMAGGFVTFDAYSGDLRETDYLPNHQPVPFATVTSFFALHFGSFGGGLVSWMYFLLGLAGAWLFYSGNLLWVESRRKVQRRGESTPSQRSDARYLAAATVGVCIGAVSGISLSLVMGKWLSGQVQDLNSWHMGIYYAVFFIAIAWAFIRGAAKSASELLFFASLTTLAIPLTSILALLIPALGLWTYTDLDTLSVDLTALVGGLILFWLAKIARKRTHNAAADSVWHLKA